MTEAIRQKASARRVLAILIGLLVTIMALQGLASVKPGGFEAFAQATASPGSPTIKLLNPDMSNSREVSNKNDGVDSLYHLVAWVSNAPSDAIVEFKYIPSAAGSREETICSSASGATNPVTFVSPDTYECKWNAAVAEGTGTIRVELFSGSSRVAFDEETVTVNNQSTTFSPAAASAETTDGDTVEIVNPTNGGEIGFYTRTGGAASGVIDVSFSMGTRSVSVFFSISAPGTEPAFRICGTETAANAADGVRCNLPADNPDTATTNERVTPNQVTAIAARVLGAAETGPGGAPNPAAEAQEPDSGDAHRALGYEQDANSVVLTNGTQDNQNPGNCSQIVTARLLDLRGRRIVGHNVDVHASGPSDQLSFDDSGDNSSPHKPADGHATESAIDCESTATTKPANGTQGEHEAPGEGDLKHVESTDGTDDKGEFRFQLFSPVAGVTQFSVWADEDQNDQFCSEEANAHGSIGWAQPAGTPVGVAFEQTSCPKPAPGATPGATPSGSPSTTRPTTSPTGTASATSTGPVTDRTVTLASNKDEMPAGRKVTFSGQVLSSDASCTDNEFIQIRRRILGTTEFRDLFATATDSQGRFSVERRAIKSAEYIAVAPSHDNCREDTSGGVTVLVKVILQILPSDKTPERGSFIRIKSSVRPQHDGSRLVLQRKKGQRWVKVATTQVNRRSIGNFRVKASFGSRTFRTFWPSQDEEHESNKSRAVTIRTQ